MNEAGCVGADCKTAVFRWASPVRPERDAIRRLMADAGWEDVAVGDCIPRPRMTGPVPFCRGTATHDGLDIALAVSGPLPEPEPWGITLQVAP